MTWDRESIARVLKAAFDEVAREPLPERLLATVKRLPERTRERD